MSGESSAPPVYHYREIDSTNDEALRLADAGAPHGTAVVADYQNAGRGQFERKWIMPPGEGVLLSVVLRDLPPDAAFGNLSVHVGERLAALLRETTRLPVEVKPPNDLMVNGRKVGGILCEARWRGAQWLHVVVGVGINVNVKRFPEELQATACSLAQAANREFDRDRLGALVIECLRRM